MDSNFVYGIIIAVLIMLSAFFSCVETAFSCANRIRLKSYADNGSKKAVTALWVTDNFDKVLTAILIGNNVVNLGCSSIATVPQLRRCDCNRRYNATRTHLWRGSTKMLW